MIVQLLAAEKKNELMIKSGALRGAYVYLDHLSSNNSELFVKPVNYSVKTRYTARGHNTAAAF